MKKNITTILMVILGNILYALSVKLFLLPGNLITGGTTGIGLALSSFIHVPLSAFIFVFNVIMLIIGYFILGKEFALTTIESTFVYPLALALCDYLLKDVVLTDDIFLCTIFSGLGIGISLGIVMRYGASTGGMDIPPLVLNKLFKIPVGVSLYAFDFIILLAQAFNNTPEKILYGIILVMIYSFVLDETLMLGTSRIEIKIISKKYDEIRKVILSQLDRGVTMIKGKGGYFENDTELILSVVSRRELPLLERIVHNVDPEAFMIVTEVKEVSGRGFTLDKKHQ